MSQKNIRTHSKKKRARSLLDENRIEEAKALYAAVCEIDPRDAESWFRLGTIHGELGALSEAERCFRKVIALQPGLAIAHYNLGRALEDLDRNEAAITTYLEALRIKPDFADACHNLGNVYFRLGRLDEALDQFRRALRIQPDHIQAVAAEARVYEKRRDYQKAYACLKPLLEAGVDNPHIALVLASLSRHLDCRGEAIAMMERLLARGEPSLPKEELIYLHFALGDLMDEAGEYDRAFSHFRAGNRLRAYHFDPEKHARYVSDLIGVYSEEYLRHAPRAAEDSQGVIFIIGMPRSGTSLVEQILDSHSQVHGCGELRDIGLMVDGLPATLGTAQAYPQCVTALTAEHCNALARQYLDRVGALSGNAAWITDKMPQNFFHLGMIAMLFPKARVLHCVRDPLDTCLSCYFQNFHYGHLSLTFSADLRNLGAYYRQYQRLMAHWMEVLDIPILDVQYEELVADQERYTREMLEFCSLPWDENCLRFYDSRRVVSTASYDQVRRPMYQKSVGRWKHYEKHLAPLKEALERG